MAQAKQQTSGPTDPLVGLRKQLGLAAFHLALASYYAVEYDLRDDAREELDAMMAKLRELNRFVKPQEQS